LDGVIKLSVAVLVAYMVLFVSHAAAAALHFLACDKTVF